MNPRNALRLADPAKQLPPQQLEDREEQLLHQILTTPPHSAEPAPAASARPQGRVARDWKPRVATAVVAVAVVVGAVVAIRSVPASDAGRSVAATPTSSTASALEAALFARLADAGQNKSSLRNLPSLTWTEASRSPTGGPVDTAGKTMFIAAVCDSGGAIAIRISGRADVHLDCTRLSAIGPIDLTAAAAKTAHGINIDVVATAGHPHYIAKGIALPNATSAIQQCTGEGLTVSATRMGGALGTDYGDIVITNHFRSACTLEGYPTARLTTRAGGSPIGATPNHILWNTHPDQGPATPTRVTLSPAGGKAYLRASTGNIVNYQRSDGTYFGACGHALTAAGWTITLPGTSKALFAPFTPGPRPVCSNPKLVISSLSQVLTAQTTHD